MPPRKPLSRSQRRMLQGTLLVAAALMLLAIMMANRPVRRVFAQQATAPSAPQTSTPPAAGEMAPTPAVSAESPRLKLRPATRT